jgi:arsenite methyltransferase
MTKQTGVWRMSADQDQVPSDVWSRWLLQLRNGGDAAFEETVRTEVAGMADRVLDGANLQPGMTLCDIGTGDGLVAFRAIDRLGPAVKVLFTDISAPLLHRARSRAAQRGVMEQCTFVQCSADQLSGIADGTIDAVTTRSALAYVADKKAALEEFHRVLKPGGRLSLVEPILQDEAYNACALKTMVDAAASRVNDPLLPLVHRWKAAQFPDTLEKVAATAITNFSERTLFESIRLCGFTKLHLELHMDLRPSILPTWKIFIESSPHPLAPTLSAILADQFSAQERQIFESKMRPLVESGQALSVGRVAYVTAEKVAV